MILPDLEPLMVPLAGLRLDPDNAREHPERNLAVLQVSLARFGQTKPIVILADGTVIAGNGMVLAARALGWVELAAVVFDSDRATQARAYALADNRTGELSRWKQAELSAELRLEAENPSLNLPSLEALGWAPYELETVWAGELPRRVAAGEATAGLGGRVEPLRMTAEQAEVIGRAVEQVRSRQPDVLSDGAAVAWLCRAALDSGSIRRWADG